MSCLFGAPEKDQDPDGLGRDLWVAMNPTEQDLTFFIPAPIAKRSWTLFVDTTAPAPYDIFPELNGPPLMGLPFIQKAKSMAVYLSQ